MHDIQHKTLNEISAEISDTRSLISDIIYTDDLYIIDTSSNYSIVSTRSSHILPKSQTTFKDIIDADTCDEIYDYLLNFEKSPLLISTEIGPAFIFGNIFPSSRLILASFPHVNISQAVTVAKNEFDGKYIISQHLQEAISKDEISEDAKLLTEQTYMRAFVPMNRVSELSNAALHEKIKSMPHQAESISLLCGAPVTVISKITDDDISRYADHSSESFDHSLYTAFLICTLLLTRKIAKNRSAELTLSSKNESPFVILSLTPLSEHLEKYAKELSTLTDISENLNIVFDYNFSNSRLNINFCPVRKDWSLYGLKDDRDLVWDLDDGH